MAPTMSKLEADYRIPPTDNKEPCRNCDMFHKGGTCDLVKGAISPHGTCKHYVHTPK